MTEPTAVQPVQVPSPASGPRFWLLGTLVLLSVVAALGGWMDRPAQELNDAALKRALVTFAVARSLNAVISMAQGTEVAVQPAGMGVNFAPGELLDPINDLIESFSSVMLYASVALGTQKLLLGIGQGLWLSGLLAVLALLWLVLRQRGSPYARTAGRFLLAFWLVRFAIPLVTLGTETAFQFFLSPEYQRSSTELGSATERIATLSAQQQAPPPEEGFLDRADRWLSSAQASLDISARMEALQVAATAAIGNMITLIVVFLLQTVAIPSALLWLGWLVVKKRLL